MRICVLTPTFLPLVGGAEVVIENLVREWNRAGHEARVLAQVPKGIEPLPQDAFDYPVRYYPRQLTQNGFFTNLRGHLGRWYREEPFDLINAHMAYPAGYVASKWGRRARVPVAITCHGGDVSATSRYRSRPWIRRRIRWGLNNAECVTAVSRELADAAEELAGGRSVRVLPNGVDPRLAEPVGPPVGVSWWRRLEDRSFLLDLKRLHPAKGHDVLLRAYASLKRDRGALPILVIAGEGAQEAELRKMIAELDLENEVIMAGGVEGDVKRWLLQNCAVFVHPSRREGMPLVIFEAMVCGRPVLAVRSEGVASQVEHGLTGLLVGPDDPEALAAEIARLLESEDLDSMSAAAREKVRSCHWDRIASLYTDTFSALLEGSG
jgi:glycosyltransferase involved in cell wall biosynthesis